MRRLAISACLCCSNDGFLGSDGETALVLDMELYFTISLLFSMEWAVFKLF